MLVELKTRYACESGNFGVGQVLDLPDSDAAALVAAGYAVPVNVEVIDDGGDALATAQLVAETAMESEPIETADARPVYKSRKGGK